jgi:hypothetical protein
VFPVGGDGPKLLAVRTVDLGTFDVVSGEVAICDPMYRRDEVEMGEVALKVGNVAKGRWQARVVRHTLDTYDKVLCAELVAFPAEVPLPAAPAWQEVHADVAADSGLAGFFDWRHFHSQAVVPPAHPWKGRLSNPNDPWYSLCCDVTAHSPDAAGVVPHGVVAHAPWGDGASTAYVLRDSAGIVVGLRLVFIFPDEYDQPE